MLCLMDADCLLVVVACLLFQPCYLAHSTSSKCGTTSTITRNDIHCQYSAKLTLNSADAARTQSSPNDYTDTWKLSYASMATSTASETALFEQFVFIEIVSDANTSMLIEPLIRESCDYSFQSDITFKSALSADRQRMIYTVILPSCNPKKVEMCTYFIVLEVSPSFMNAMTRTQETAVHRSNHNQSAAAMAVHVDYEFRASLGILLQFQQKYSYSVVANDQDDTVVATDDDDDDDPSDAAAGDTPLLDGAADSGETVDVGVELLNRINKEEVNDVTNMTCVHRQFYGLTASLTDFPVGIIIQPEFIDSDASFEVTQYTSAPDAVYHVKTINKLQGDAESESYNVPPSGYKSSEDYVLLDVRFYTLDDQANMLESQSQTLLPNIKYIIYSQANTSAIQVAVMNSGGWFLMLILVVLILIAMCRKHCCLRNAQQQRLSYNEILENIALQNPLFANYRNNNDDQAGSSTNNTGDENKSVGISPEELDAVSTTEVYPKKKSRMSLNYKQNRQIYKYRACCICLFDYRPGDQIRKLNCNHYFHKQCIDIWFKRNIQCPLCKQYVINAQILSKRSSRHSDVSTSTSTSSSSSHTSTSQSSSTSESKSRSEDGDRERKGATGTALKPQRGKPQPTTNLTKVTVTADDWSIPACIQEEEMKHETEMQNVKHHIKSMESQQTYSLSDSHCVHPPTRAPKTRSHSDDMHMFSHSHRNMTTARHRTRHSHSKSCSRSLSAHTQTHTHSSRPCEVTFHHNSHPTTTTTTACPTTTITGARSSSNESSMSPSTGTGISQQQQHHELGLLDDKNTFIPLTVSPNLTPKINLYFMSPTPPNPKEE